jgi:hypothetical protein
MLHATGHDSLAVGNACAALPATASKQQSCSRVLCNVFCPALRQLVCYICGYAQNVFATPGAASPCLRQHPAWCTPRIFELQYVTNAPLCIAVETPSHPTHNPERASCVECVGQSVLVASCRMQQEQHHAACNPPPQPQGCNILAHLRHLTANSTGHVETQTKAARLLSATD